MRSICLVLAIVKFVNSFALIPPATSRPSGSTPGPLKTKVDKMRGSRRGLTSYSTYVFLGLRAWQTALS